MRSCQITLGLSTVVSNPVFRLVTQDSCQLKSIDRCRWASLRHHDFYFIWEVQWHVWYQPIIKKCRIGGTFQKDPGFMTCADFKLDSKHPKGQVEARQLIELVQKFITEDPHLTDTYRIHQNTS